MTTDRPADIYLHTCRESGSRGSPPLHLSRPTVLTSRCFSAWQSASLKSGCPPPFQVFPLLPHALFISCFLSSLPFFSSVLVLLPLSSSFVFLLFLFLFLLFLPLFLSYFLSLVHSTSLLFSLRLSHSHQREATSLSHGVPACGGHLAYLSLRIARSSRAKGRISQRDGGGMRRVEGGRIARGRWRGGNAGEVSREGGRGERGPRSKQQAPGRNKWERERDRLTHDKQRGSYSDIGSGMAKW